MKHFPIARILFSASKQKAGVLGSCNWKDGEKRTIRIDPTHASPARTLLHEYLHLINPEWSEARVLREERKRWSKLTWKDKSRLYQQLGKAKIEIPLQDLTEDE